MPASKYFHILFAGAQAKKTFYHRQKKNVCSFNVNNRNFKFSNFTNLRKVAREKIVSQFNDNCSLFSLRQSKDENVRKRERESLPQSPFWLLRAPHRISQIPISVSYCNNPDKLSVGYL